MTSMIVANDIDGGIGNKGSLPWPKNEKDMNRLKAITTGTVLVMGRKTFESLPKKLSDRIHVVLTSSQDYEHEDADEIAVPRKDFDPSDFISYLRDKYKKEVFIFGGKEIYDLFLDQVDTLFLTTMQDKYDCDTHINRDNIVENIPHCIFREDDDDMVYEVYVRDLEVKIPAKVLTISKNS